MPRFGGRIVIRRFDTPPRDLRSLAEPVVVNCTGLGSFTLFDDRELLPIKGQLTVLVAQPEVNYRAGGRTPSGGNASIAHAPARVLRHHFDGFSSKTAIATPSQGFLPGLPADSRPSGITPVVCGVSPNVAIR